VTDYVVMPFVFSSGQINAFSLSTRRPGGFSVADLGAIYEVLPLLSRIFEVHAMRLNAVNLLDVYLGKQSGAKVLDGLLKRGDGEDVHAVIWFSDLRNSTRLAESMPRRKFLALLDDFFDCTAGAVLEQGGEVLRFIGDASLAIFPISEADAEAAQIAPQAARACESALSAALEAHRRMQESNTRRTQAGETKLDLGVGLHVGDVMYGNIGTPGPARIQRHRTRRERGRAHRGDVQDARGFSNRVGRIRQSRSRPAALARAPCAARVAEPQELYTLRV
jgi:adenylate cyclase